MFGTDAHFFQICLVLSGSNQCKDKEATIDVIYLQIYMVGPREAAHI